ncbi:MAG: preprotein translocase subunit SecA [Acidimicrobiia bacterium]|nr:preprotein translocase subunit SecA [Acidimicrobiia bacterium]MDH4308445.1 preprotein translocase subunit SecA [Acidimicrobiia bacterium]
MSIFTKMLRAGEGRALKDLEKIAVAVNAIETDFEKLSDQELAAKTVEFREQLANGAELDDVMVPAFATVREAAKRVLGQRHYDVQIIGGGALHRGMVAEMRTGEGKTLVSTLPVYLNALAGQGVHVVTVNDYLASRDAEWMGGVHRFLGLSVGLIQAGLTPAERRPAYNSDVTYGTNNEFGFDYLRDNMAMRPQDMVQRGHHYAIVDEVDSILIDEARTPLIISGRVSGAADWYKTFAVVSQELKRDEHYEVDEGKRQVLITEDGVAYVERRLNVENLYDEVAIDLVHHLETSLKAKELYHLDVDYLVDHGEVKIVDEFTGRVLEGRRYSEGLHQAIEAKEKVHIKEESQTLATITLQNYFRLYEKLAGMTGTAETEAAELAQIYDLQVVVVPTNRPIARADQPDLVYKTEEAKFEAVVSDVEERVAAGQPILLGTVSIEKSELVSRLMTKRGIKHDVLNAKQHAREAEIIAQAGQPGSVTVATNMAGRGVDIMLGGNAEALAKLELRRQGTEVDAEDYETKLAELSQRFSDQIKHDRKRVTDAGGLYVIGTERHESRRIDNQLRGRSGRQGDPGESRFYLSLEDELMRRFQGERVAAIMGRLKIPDDVPIEHKWVTNAVERAQRQVESQNFEIRKNVLKYDEVMNKQREVIYRWRAGILHDESTEELALEWLESVMESTVLDTFGSDTTPNQWEWDDLNTALSLYFPSELTKEQFGGRPTLDDVVERAIEDGRAAYEQRKEELGPEILAQVERSVMLTVIDNKWREHLAEMDYLRAGIGLRAMGQRDPLTEYQREAFDGFAVLVDSVKSDSVRYIYKAQVTQPESAPPPRIEPSQTGPVRQASSDKVGRNQPCPCGSGKKYKMCHGAA